MSGARKWSTGRNLRYRLFSPITLDYSSHGHWETEMAAGVMAVIGLFIGVWGFLVMRNPYRLSILAPSQRGYYQRLVLDTMQRNLLRVLGAFICLFGSTISAHAIASVSKAHTFDAIGEALGLLLAVTFGIGFFAGVVITSIQTARGELLNW